MATFLLGFSSSVVPMIFPFPSACGGGAGGGCSFDVLSATLFDVGCERWGKRPLWFASFVGILVVSFRDEMAELLFCFSESAVVVVVVVVVGLLTGRCESLLEPAECEGLPCALDLSQKLTRSKNECESDEVSFIDVESKESGRWRLISWIEV